MTRLPQKEGYVFLENVCNNQLLGLRFQSGYAFLVKIKVISTL